MPHFRVDDALHSHPKARKAGFEAMGMWTLAGSHCMAYLTDGFVADWWVKEKPKGLALAKRLVAAGFWHPAEKDGEQGWQFHEFTGPGRNDSREQILADREKWRKRKESQRASAQVSPVDNTGDTTGDATQDTRESPGYIPNPTQPIQRDDSPFVVSSPDVGVERGLSNAVSPTASRLVAALIPDTFPAAVRTSLRLHASQLMNGDGLDADTVADTLRRWLAKPDAGPGLLPSLAADVIKARAAPGTNGRPPHKMRALVDLAAEVRAEEQAQLESAARKAIE